MDSKRILLISHYLEATGAPMSLLRHAKYLVEAGHNVEVWSLDCYPGSGLASAFVAASLNVRHVKNDEDHIAAALHDAGVCYDLIVCNTICTYKCIKVLQRMKIPTIWFVRETVLADKWAVHNIEFCNLFKRFYNIYCPAEYAAVQMRFYNRNIRVVRNAVPDEFSGYTPLSDNLRFGFIGSVYPLKGADVLVEAFEILRNRHAGISLKIAGSTYTRFAKSLVCKTSTDAAVIWMGEIKGPDKKLFFDSIDILCVPSLEESFGLTAAEGAMYGKIVITTDHIGAKCFSEGIKGAIVKAGSARALEKAMSRFISLDKNELRRLQEISRANYLKYGAMDQERKAVLKMVSDNIGKCPPSQKGHIFDEILLGRSLSSKIIRRLRRYYLNFALMLIGRGDWNKRAARCTT